MSASPIAQGRLKMPDKQPTAVTRYTVTLETGHYEIDPFLGCPSIVVLDDDYNTLADYCAELVKALRESRLWVELDDEGFGRGGPGGTTVLVATIDELLAKWGDNDS